jgi:cell division protein FtsL
MIHRGLLFWSVVAVATAVGLFTVKYKVQDLEERIDRTNQKIIESQQATHILRVEWAHLNESERIEALAQKHLKLESASIKQVVRLDQLKPESVPPAARSTTSFPPHERATTSPRRLCPGGGGRVAAEAGSPSPASAPLSKRTPGPTTPPRPAQIQEPATSGPVGDGQSAAVSIDDILSRNEGGSPVKLWRKSASPEPAAAVNAAAGARYASPKDRLKGDVQETARQRLVIASGDLWHRLHGRRPAHGLRLAAARRR